MSSEDLAESPYRNRALPKRIERTMPHGQFVLGAGAGAPLFEQRMPVITALVYDGLTRPIVKLLDHDPTHIDKQSRYRWLERAKRYFEVVAWEGVLRYTLPALAPYLNFATTIFRAYTPAILVACRTRGS